MEEPRVVSSRKSPPDSESWYQYIWKAEQETPNRIEDAAKFLASMISITLTLFLAIGKTSFAPHLASTGIKIAVVLWMLSLLSAFWVLFPHRYRYVSHSLQSIKTLNQRIVTVKYRLLLLSLTLFFASLVILTVFFFR